MNIGKHFTGLSRLGFPLGVRNSLRWHLPQMEHHMSLIKTRWGLIPPKGTIITGLRSQKMPKTLDEIYPLSIGSIKFSKQAQTMAYINHDAQDNFFDVIRGQFYPHRELKESDAVPGVSFLMDGKDVAGVRVRNVFEPHEVLGAKGEEYIKVFMERNGIPHLYVGQGPTGVQKSDVLKNDLQAHRPDFLIHLPDLGTLFFDVKCRKRRAFNEKGEACFYMFKSEMESLIKLHYNLFIPVWVAFLDSDSIKRNDEKPTLHLICASQLESFWTSMKRNLTEREAQSLGVIRLPGALLQEVKEKLEFKIGVQKIPEELVSRYADLHKGILRRIEDEVRNYIRKNSVMKTWFARKMLTSQKLRFLVDADVTSAFLSMIQEKVICYEAGKPLTLVGE